MLLVDRVQAGVDGAVEHHGPHAVGVWLGVGRAEFGAVGEAEIVDLVLAERRAHHVHVPRRRRGADVGQKIRAHPLRARVGELAVERFDVRDPAGL